MHKRYAIFDMDGTLVDSMTAWRDLGKTFLLSKGVSIPADLRERIITMTMPETGVYFNELGIPGSPKELADEMNECMHEQYRTTILPCEGAAAYLEALTSRGITLCIATATDARLATTCLERLGLMRYFSFIASCEDSGIGKHEPHIYLDCMRRLGACLPAEVAVYEDAPYAARTAKAAGFYTIGVFDASAIHKQEALLAIVDQYITGYPEALAAFEQEESK